MRGEAVQAPDAARHLLLQRHAAGPAVSEEALPTWDRPRHEVMVVEDCNLKRGGSDGRRGHRTGRRLGACLPPRLLAIRRQINQAFCSCLLIDSTGVAGALVTDGFASMLAEDLVRRL